MRGFSRACVALFLHDDHYFGRKSITLWKIHLCYLLNVCSFIVTVEESNTCINKSRLFNAAAAQVINLAPC